ncbi:MAG TPA: hypothetical protein DD473_22280 [Planctomycetaceae bacterium]|nr:hypothetical protein [Planctomycetaceae bacterium]
MANSRRQYSVEFKQEAVNLVTLQSHPQSMRKPCAESPPGLTRFQPTDSLPEKPAGLWEEL